MKTKCLVIPTKNITQFQKEGAWTTISAEVMQVHIVELELGGLSEKVKPTKSDSIAGEVLQK